MKGVYADPLERFWRHVKKRDDGCWEWTASKLSNGYGQMFYRFVCGKRENILAHRLAYEAFVESVPDGLDLDHLCRNRWCVNPEHLEPVSRSENLLRSPLMGGHNSAKTHCPQGHPYSGPNLYVHGGARRCKSCRLATSRRFKATLKSRANAIGAAGLKPRNKD